MTKSNWSMGVKRAAMAGAGALAMGVAGAAQSAILLSEGFEDLATSGWVLKNNSTQPAIVADWFQGNPLVFTAASGSPNSYAAANFENGAAPGTISNWLISPLIEFTGPAALDFSLRLLGEGFLDTVEVYFSSAGASTDVGDSTTSTGTFELVGEFSSDTDTLWTNETALIGGINENSGRFAFRYFVADTLVDGNYVGIDNVLVTTEEPAPVPEPSTYALLLGGLGLLGFMARRRRA